MALTATNIPLLIQAGEFSCLRCGSDRCRGAVDRGLRPLTNPLAGFCNRCEHR